MSDSRAYALVAQFVGHQSQIVIPKAFIKALEGDLGAALLLCLLYQEQVRVGDGVTWSRKITEFEESMMMTAKRIRRCLDVLEKTQLVKAKVKSVKGTPVLHYLVSLDGCVGLLLDESQFPKPEIDATQPISELVKSETVEPDVPISETGNLHAHGIRSNLILDTSVPEEKYVEEYNSQVSIQDGMGVGKGVSLFEETIQRYDCSKSTDCLIREIHGLFASIPAYVDYLPPTDDKYETLIGWIRANAPHEEGVRAEFASFKVYFTNKKQSKGEKRPVQALMNWLGKRAGAWAVQRARREPEPLFVCNIGTGLVVESAVEKAKRLIIDREDLF